MVNKKGYLKTLEAVLAIVLILIFTFAITPKPEISQEAPYTITASQEFIMHEIETNDNIRTLLMNADNDFHSAFEAVDNLISYNLPPGYDYTFGICNQSACYSNITPIAVERSVYASDVLVSSNGSMQKPMIIRLWVWKKSG